MDVDDQGITSDDDDVEEIINEANGGNVEKMFELANIYRYGVGSAEQNLSLAYKWYQNAANNGNATAHAYVGKMLLDGTSGQDGKVGRIISIKEEGIERLNMSANEGSDLAAYMLGDIYSQGLHDIPRDVTKALFWYRAAINPTLGGHCNHKTLGDGTISYITKDILYRLERKIVVPPTDIPT